MVHPPYARAIGGPSYLPNIGCYSLPSDAVKALPDAECALPFSKVPENCQRKGPLKQTKNYCNPVVQDDEADGRLHAIGRVDSQEGSTIVVVQFYLTAESQAGNAVGLQRSAPVLVQNPDGHVRVGNILWHPHGDKRCA